MNFFAKFIIILGIYSSVDRDRSIGKKELGVKGYGGCIVLLEIFASGYQKKPGIL